MSDNEQTLELNAPEKIPGTKLVGPQDYVSPGERRQRIRTMENLLASGNTDTEIEDILAEKYRMTPGGCRDLRFKVYELWANEEAERNPHLKAAAKRRLYDALREAKADRSWSAVANLEKVLSGIEGTTVDPRERATPAENRILESALRILNESDKDYVLQVIQTGLQITTKKGVDAESQKLIDVTPKEKKCLPSTS